MHKIGPNWGNRLSGKLANRNWLSWKKISTKLCVDFAVYYVKWWWFDKLFQGHNFACNVHCMIGAMMLDTVCLSETAGRKTAKDDAIAVQLETLRPSLDRRKIFDDLRRLKDDDVSSSNPTMSLICIYLRFVGNSASGTFWLLVVYSNH